MINIEKNSQEGVAKNPRRNVITSGIDGDYPTRMNRMVKMNQKNI